MNTKVLLLLCFITFFLLPDADAWGGRRIRIRRIVKPLCKMACKFHGCSYVWASGVARYVCKKTCNNVCGILGDEPMMKIAQDESVSQDAAKGKDNFVLLQPGKMSDYDTNEDGRISKAEFLAAMPRSDNNRGVEEVFDKQDLNGDGYLDCNEFKSAKLDFDQKPQC